MSLCPCCKQPMHEYTQPSLLPQRPSFQLAECHTEECPLYMATLSVGVHERLTAEQIKGYGKVNRSQQKQVRA